MNIRKILADDDIKQLQEIFDETPELIYTCKISGHDPLSWALAHKTCKLCIAYLKKHYHIENICPTDYTYSGWHALRLNPTLTFAKQLSRLNGYDRAINHYNDKGDTPLSTMICHNLLLKPFKLDKEKSVALIAFMVEHGADVNKIQEKSGKSAFQLLADRIKYKPLLLLYLNQITSHTRYEINFNHQDNNGDTLFHTMSKMINSVSNESSVNKKMLSFMSKAIEDNKANLDIKNKDGVSAKSILEKHLNHFSLEIQDMFSNNLRFRLEEKAVNSVKTASTGLRKARL